MVWKFKAFWSMIWFAITIVIGAGLLWYIDSHSMGHRLDDLRAGKAGQIVGVLLGLGLLVIWSPFFAPRGRRDRDPM
jgi:hypothetical protein